MYVRLPRDLHQAVRDRSGEEDRTMAQTIRVALRYYLQETKPLASQVSDQLSQVAGRSA